MILQIAPDAGQFMRERYAMRCKFDGGADTGQKQQLRRAERAAAQDDLALRLDAVFLAAFQITQAGGALAANPRLPVERPCPRSEAMGS